MRQGASALAAMGAAGRVLPAKPVESLALTGGPKTVSYPAGRHTFVTRWPRYGESEKQALHELIDSGKFYEELPLFEKDWQAYTKAPFVKAHCNGTSALTSLFFALDLPPGSEILVPSYTFFATVLPMRFFGYVPVFVDLNPRTATFDIDDAARKVTSRTKALMPMHSWGLPCDMDRIEKFARDRGLILLEDAAQAHGASMNGRMMGTWGVMGIYSFQLSKVLPAIEGGMGMYQTRAYYERAAAFGHYEDPVKFSQDSPVRPYEGTGFGQKYRMHPMAAAVARRQLQGLDERNVLVKSQVQKLNSRLVQLPGLAEPRCRPEQNRAYYYGNMLFLDEKKAGFSRDALLKALQAEGVRASMWDYPLQHKFKIYSESKWWHHPIQIPATLAGAEEVNRTHIFLPLFHSDVPELTEQYVQAFEKVWAHKSELAKV